MYSSKRLEEGWTTLFLVFAMIFVAASAIVQSELIDGLEIIPAVAITGLLAGFGLAKSRFPNNTAHLFSLVYGLFAVIFFIGMTLPETMPWRERVFDIVNRQVLWLEKAFGEGRSRDGLIFVIQTSAVYWLLGYTAAWYTFRYPRVWRVVVPTGLVLLSVVYYYEGPARLTIFLAVYALLSLIYTARTYVVEQERTWRAGRVRYEPGIWYSFLRASFLAALIALIVAGLMPTFTASAAVGDMFSVTRGPWRDFQDNWTRLFSSLRTYSTTTNDPYLDTLALGGPRSVGNTPIMDVIVTRELPYVYWQAVAYDSYENGGWKIDDDYQTLLYDPENGVLSTPVVQSREIITHTVVNYLPNSSLIYGAPEIISVDRPSFVDMRTDSQGRVLMTSLRSQFVLRLNDRYVVTARVSNADATSLRNASIAYPDWVTERYLQLPATISPETLALAEELTAPFANPFDKALVIRDFLRQNIAYNDQIAAPPDGVDPVHYVLFVSQEGYCNYYASAMAIMLRSQGIPARIVSGYAQGAYDEETMTYRVRASNAHTWVEVYFPAYGWIQFEPTAALPLVERLEGGGNPGDAFGNESAGNNPFFDQDTPLLDDEVLDFERGGDEVNPNDAANPEPIDSASFWERVPPWQIALAVGLVAVAGLLLLAANEVNKRVEADVVRSYSRLDTWARWLGIFFRPAQTPYERADALGTAVPEGSRFIEKLTTYFVTRQFSPRRDALANPHREWQALRPLLIRKALSYRLERLRTRRRKR